MKVAALIVVLVVALFAIGMSRKQRSNRNASGADSGGVGDSDSPAADTGHCGADSGSDGACDGGGDGGGGGD